MKLVSNSTVSFTTVSLLAALLPLASVLTVETGLAAETGGIAKVMTVSPTTTFDGRKIEEDAVIGTLGSLKTGSEGGAKIRLVQNGVVLEVAANSELKIILPESGNVSEAVELVTGSVRIRVPPAEKKSDRKPTFTLRSKTVTMGVRGTEFLSVVTPVLSEAELVVFKGTVEFTSQKDVKDTRMVEAGFWTGMGGRYGKKTQTPIHLSKEALAHFEKVGHGIPAYVVPKPDEKSTGTSTPGAAVRSESGH